MPASHRKPNQGPAAASSKASSSGQTPATPAAPATSKPSTPAKQAPAKTPAPGKPSRAPKAPIDPDADLRDDSLAIEDESAAEMPATARARTRTRPAGAVPAERRRRRGSESSRNPILRGLRGYFGAYVPLFALFCVIFVGVFVYATVTHTPTAAESWTSITEKWKPQTDAARAKVFAAAEKKDVPAEMAAFKELSTAIRGWADALEKSPTHWTAKTGVETDNQQTASGILQYITDARAYAIAIDSVTKVGTSDALAQNSDELTQDDDNWNQEYRALVFLILAMDPLASTTPVATLILPTQVPSAAPAASGSASASGSTGPSASPSASVTVAPSPSPSPSPSPLPSAS